MDDRGESFGKALREIITELTGNEFGGEDNYRLISKYVKGLMESGRVKSFEQLLEMLLRDESLFDEFISRITVHHTSWFRDAKQFGILEAFATDHAKAQNEIFEVLCAACSTGEEAYTIGLVLEKVRKSHPRFEYRILALDIDSKSLAKARANNFDAKDIQLVPAEMRMFVHQRGDRFAVSDSIVGRIEFRRFNLLEKLQTPTRFHAVFLRHILIYLSHERQLRVVKNLVELMQPEGRIFLGASEAQDFSQLGIHNTSYSVFVGSNRARRKVLAIEDSKLIQAKLREIFKGSTFDVLYAGSLKEADQILEREKIEGLSLDIHLPDGLGTKWLKQRYESGWRVPTMIVSQLSEVEAKENLQDILKYSHGYIEKKSIASKQNELKGFFEQTVGAERVAKPLATAVRTSVSNRLTRTPSAILIGASTGGPHALTALLRNWPAHSPPVVVVQHIEKNFLATFAQSLQTITGLRLWDGADGPLRPGHLYVALDDYHLALHEVEGQWHIRKDFGEYENRHRPSVDRLFKSCSSKPGKKAVTGLVGIVLTGMGKDGAVGLKALREGGATTIIQDQATSVVWGMPGEAARLDAATFIADLATIRSRLLSCMTASKTSKLKSA